MINILIVEDDEEIIQFCNDAWHRLDDGIKVFVAQSAEEALLILKQNRIDGTFIDIGLPGDNGFSLAMKIQSMENYHFLPIVFETGENKDLPETYKKYHNFGYLSKPFTEKDLLDSTATLIREIETQKNILHKNIDREIPIFDSEGQSIISFSNLLYATKYERKLKVATKNGVHFISGLSMNDFIARIDEEMFTKCNRALAVNVINIDRIEPIGYKAWNIYFSDSDVEECLLSYKYKKEIDRLLKKRLE